MNHLLTLSEKLVLLATDIRKGCIVPNAGISLNYCIAGAVLFEMIEAGVLKSEHERVVEWPKASTGNALFDLGLKRVAHLDKVKSVKFWIEALSATADSMRTMILEGLVDKGILEKQDKVFLWVFHLNRYPEHDAEPENHIRERLISIIEGQTEPDQEDLVLLGIVKAADMIGTVFPKPMRKESRKKIDELTHVDRFSSELVTIIQDIQTAIITVMVAGIAVVAAT